MPIKLISVFCGSNQPASVVFEEAVISLALSQILFSSLLELLVKHIQPFQPEIKPTQWWPEEELPSVIPFSVFKTHQEKPESMQFAHEFSRRNR